MSVPLVPGRAFVTPASAKNRGSGGPDGGNENNFSSGGRARSVITLIVRSTETGPPLNTEAQKVKVRLPNWLRIVLFDAGTSYGLWKELPEEFEVPVLVDPLTGKIESMDVEATERELAAYEKLGRRQFRRTEDPIMSPIHLVKESPGMLRRGAKAAFRDLKDLKENVKDLGKTGPGDLKAPDESEMEARRRTANQLGLLHDRNPKQREKVRESALQAGPSFVQMMQGESIHPLEFEHWLDFQVRSKVITEEEADAWRQQANEPPPG